MKHHNLKKILTFLVCLGFAGMGMVTATGCASSANKESTGEYIDNSAITAKVKAAFVSDDTVKAGSVKVVTYKGIVQLSGFVDTQAEKAQAEKVARGVAGVLGVENNITVKTK